MRLVLDRCIVKRKSFGTRQADMGIIAFLIRHHAMEYEIIIVLEESSWTILHVCGQIRLQQQCAIAQTRLSFHWNESISEADTPFDLTYCIRLI